MPTDALLGDQGNILPPYEPKSTTHKKTNTQKLEIYFINRKKASDVKRKSSKNQKENIIQVYVEPYQNLINNYFKKKFK